MMGFWVKQKESMTWKIRKKRSNFQELFFFSFSCERWDEIHMYKWSHGIGERDGRWRVTKKVWNVTWPKSPVASLITRFFLRPMDILWSPLVRLAAGFWRVLAHLVGNTETWNIFLLRSNFQVVCTQYTYTYYWLNPDPFDFYLFLFCQTLNFLPIYIFVLTG